MQDYSRRALLTATAGAVVSLIAAHPASAGAIPKTAVTYQENPKDGHQCSGCKLFIAGADAAAEGTCKSVAGPIKPDGWCKLWAAKEA